MASRWLRRLRRRAKRVSPTWRIVLYDGAGPCQQVEVVAMGCDDVYLTPTARWGNASPSNHREAARFESTEATKSLRQTRKLRRQTAIQRISRADPGR